MNQRNTLRNTLIIWMLLSCAACRKADTTLVSHDVSGVFSVSLPANMQPKNDMHEYAPIQFADERTDFYALGIDDPKKKLGELMRENMTLKAYYGFVETTVFSSADTAIQVNNQTFSHNNVQAYYGDYRVKATLKNKQYDLYYRIAVYESQHHYFQLVLWLPESEYEQHKATLDDITRSVSLQNKEKA